jgi:thiamine phosphate synthase YjbQ (UPF0047 family)
MKTSTKELWMKVPERRAFISIHHEVERLVAESGVQDGLSGSPFLFVQGLGA